MMVFRLRFSRQILNPFAIFWLRHYSGYDQYNYVLDPIIVVTRVHDVQLCRSIYIITTLTLINVLSILQFVQLGLQTHKGNTYKNTYLHISMCEN